MSVSSIGNMPFTRAISYLVGKLRRVPFGQNHLLKLDRDLSTGKKSCSFVAAMVGMPQDKTFFGNG